jgi:flagellar biosynthesis protein FliQ
MIAILSDDHQVMTPTIAFLPKIVFLKIAFLLKDSKDESIQFSGAICIH